MRQVEDAAVGLVQHQAARPNPNPNPDPDPNPSPDPDPNPNPDPDPSPNPDPDPDAFCERLQAQNDAWGVRDATAVAETARARHGLELVAREEMPANNFMLVFRKAPA